MDTETPSNNEIQTNNNTVLSDNKVKSEINKYNKLDEGPFRVMFNKENLNMIKLGKSLKINRIQNIENVEMLSKNMARVTFKKHEDANSCVINDVLKKFDGYDIFIPDNFVHTIGLIKNIPSEITTKEILDNLKSPIPFVKIERMTKWNTQTEKAEDTEMVKIYFKANTIPQKVTMYDNILTKVCYYIPNPLHCRKRMNYGHTIKRCRSKINQSCSTCARAYDDLHDCDKRERCKFCGIGHKTNVRECQERYRQKQIMEYIIVNKSSYKEAREKLYGRRQQVPRMLDFTNDIQNSQHKTVGAEHHDKKLQILTELVDTLKRQIKKRVTNKETPNGQARLDLLLIDIKSILQNNNGGQNNSIFKQ